MADNERRPGFTDASYIRQDEAPNLPRVFSNAPAGEKEPEKKGVSHGMTALLCAACLVVGMWIGENKAEESDTAPSPLPVAGSVAGALPRRSAGETCLPEQEDARLGVTGHTVSAAVAEYYDLYWDEQAVEGVQIFSLDEGGLGEQAGLRPGDIIVEMNGEPIRSAAELDAAEECFCAGSEAVISVYRDGNMTELPLRFAGDGETAD